MSLLTFIRRDCVRDFILTVASLGLVQGPPDKISASISPLKGKERRLEVSSKLTQFISDLDLHQVRVRRPSDFVFLCGGPINFGTLAPLSKILSLRDFIYRDISKLIEPRLVLAESATKIFELSGYRDLVAFEKDIARISSLVALVSETAGSLAELGAFSQIPEIAKVLYVIVEESLHGESQSFVRLGPFLALENLDGDHDRVGDFVWKSREDKSIVKSSVINQRKEIAHSINERAIGGFETLDVDNAAHVMIIIYWVTHVLRGARLIEIKTYLKQFGIEIDQSTAKRYIYCMRVAGWLGEKNVGSSYFYPIVDSDVFEYAFVPGVNDKSPVRRKVDIATQVERSKERRPKSVAERIGIDG